MRSELHPPASGPWSGSRSFAGRTGGHPEYLGFSFCHLVWLWSDECLMS